MEEKTFFRILEDKESDLLKVCIGDKSTYSVYFPPCKYLTPNMLTKTFFESHICCKSKYNSNLIVSLNGKVLSVNNSEKSMQSFLGFKKNLKFFILSEGSRDVSIAGSSGSQTINVIVIDNVIDDGGYTIGTTVKVEKDANQENKLIRYYTKEDYLDRYRGLLAASNEFTEVDIRLQEATKRLLNDYMLVSGYEGLYGQLHFQEEVRPIEQVRLSD